MNAREADEWVDLQMKHRNAAHVLVERYHVRVEARPSGQLGFVTPCYREVIQYDFMAAQIALDAIAMPVRFGAEI